MKRKYPKLITLLIENVEEDQHLVEQTSQKLPEKTEVNKKSRVGLSRGSLYRKRYYGRY